MTAEAVDDLLARASSRLEVRSGDAKSGSLFEQMEVDGDRYFVKRVSRASDWIMRVTGDAVHRPYRAWRAGLMQRAPACIDHTVVAMQIDGDGDAAVLTIVMRDVAAHLVPEGNDAVLEAQHQGFIEHMAELSSEFWGWNDSVGLTTMAQRVRIFAPDNIAPELAASEVPGPITAAAAGWRILADRSPMLWAVADTLHRRPELVTAPLAETPHTFQHGDWKMGNLGTHPDGRTILVDWAMPGSGPACWDLCWYLALNRARLPESKEATIDRFQQALEAGGIATRGWWQPQLDLCLIGMMATFAWEKAHGDEGELRWWEQAVGAAVRRQALPLPGDK